MDAPLLHGRRRLDRRGQVDARQQPRRRRGQRRRACCARPRGRRCSPATRTTCAGSRTTASSRASPRTTGGAAGAGRPPARRRPTRCPRARAARRARHRLGRRGQPRRSPRQLLAAADAWLFVTTAARYADAVPWDLLHAARDRGTALSLVLNRVPPDAEDEVAGAPARDARRARAGRHASCSSSREATLEDGLLPAAGARAGPRAGSTRSRRRAGARRARAPHARRRARQPCPPRVGGRRRRGRASRRRPRARCAPRSTARTRDALDEVDEAVRSGSLLRGEVLARWHDVVGTGDLMRAIETRVGWAARPAARRSSPGGRAADAELRDAVESERRRRRARRRRPRGRARRAGVARRAPRAGRCSTAPRGLDGASPGLRDATARRGRARGRATSSSSSAPRARASARRRGSRRSASTARA